MLKFKNSDFLMAKRSKQNRARQNKARAGCMSGIVSIFAFRHGRITRQLLSDHGTHMTESTIGPSNPTSEVNSITDSEEMMHLWIESQNGEKGETAHSRVKELMEEEMQGVVECDVETERTSFDYRQISKDQPVPSQYCHFEDLMNELLLIHQKKNEEQNPKSLERSNSLQNERSNPSSNDPNSRKPRNFFRRRSKSHECISFENDTNLPSNKLHSERNFPQFSFTEIKKKLKNAIGRSKRDSGCHERPVVEGSSVRSSPSRDQFYSERFTRISDGFRIEDGASRSFNFETKLRENQRFGDRSDRISNIYVEAKKHLSEMVGNGNECTDLVVARHPRTLGNLLSFPDYECSSADIEHENEPDHRVNESQPFVTDDDHEELEVSDEIHETEDVIETVKPPSPEEYEVLDASDLTEDDELPCSPIASPSRFSLVNQKTDKVDDRNGKPSPVSVLEPLFSDDNISPARTISRSGETSMQPLRIRFEEPITPTENQETCNYNHVKNEESTFEYIEAVLLASDLNWGEFEKRWLYNVQILDQSLYEELQIFSSRPIHDQRLLFDSTNEILKELCDCSLGLFPELPFFKTTIHRIPKGMELINEVWKRIESRLNCAHLQSLDQLISNDLEISRMWMDLCLETREIVMETEEWILEDLIDDTLLSLMDIN